MAHKVHCEKCDHDDPLRCKGGLHKGHGRVQVCFCPCHNLYLVGKATGVDVDDDEVQLPEGMPKTVPTELVLQEVREVVGDYIFKAVQTGYNLSRFYATNEWSVPVREQLASVQHEIWSHWMKYLYSRWYKVGEERLDIPLEELKRWQRQMQTPYTDLTPKEKDSDREQADKVLNVLVESMGVPVEAEPEWCPSCGADGTEFKKVGPCTYCCGRCDTSWQIEKLEGGVL